MDLVNIMLSETSQKQKATYCIISYIQNVQNRQIHKNKINLWFPGTGKTLDYPFANELTQSAGHQNWTEINLKILERNES